MMTEYDIPNKLDKEIGAVLLTLFVFTFESDSDLLILVLVLFEVLVDVLTLLLLTFWLYKDDLNGFF